MENELSMKDMMEHIESSMKRIKKGDVIKGKVITVLDKEVVVNIGYITDAIIPIEEVVLKDNETLKDKIKVDDIIYGYVLKVNDGDGNVLLSKSKADKINTLKRLNEAFKNKDTLEVTIKEEVKGGVITYIDEIRGFIPISQLDVKFIKSAKEFIGKTLKTKIIEFDKNKQKLVLSSRIIKEQEIQKNKNKIWNALQEGEKREGIVTKLEKFGAFIDIGGIEGLVHNSELSWGRVNHPSEVVNIGDEVEVYVLNFDKQKKRLALSLKNVKNDPWNEIEQKFKISQIVEGKVTKVLNFGAIVEIAQGIEGLVHISEITDENITKVSDKLKVLDNVKVKILEINKQDKRISLSIKEALEGNGEEITKYDDSTVEDVTLGDLFKDKFKDLFD